MRPAAPPSPSPQLELTLASSSPAAIPLLVSWSQWTIANYYLSQGLSAAPPPADADDEDAAMEPASRKVGEPDELLGVVFSLEEVRGVCDEVLNIAGAHIAEVRPLSLSFELPCKHRADSLRARRARRSGRCGVTSRWTSSRCVPLHPFSSTRGLLSFI